MSSAPNVLAARTPSRLLAPLCAAALAVALIYLAGFAEAEVLHNGAHDARHAAAFPCH